MFTRAARMGRLLTIAAAGGCAGFLAAFAVVAIPDVKAASVDPSFDIHLYDSRLTPTAIHVKQGQLVQIDVTNHGSQPHNLVIPAFYIFTQNLQPGEDVRASFRPDKSGRFPYYSDTGGKPEPGIRGTLTVSP